MRGALHAVVVAARAVTGRDRHRRAAALVRPPQGSRAAGWLERAEIAVLALDELTASALPGPLTTAVSGAAVEAADTLRALNRLGHQVTTVESALTRVHDPELHAEVARLTATVDAAPPAVQEEVARSAAALRDRQDVLERLLDVRTTLLARMQAVTLGLEGLVARVSEVLALSATTGAVEDPAGQVAELAHGLESLRAGLAETEDLTRAALSGSSRPQP